MQGGISSLKYAATSVVKKFDEIKEAISANSTPVKASIGGNGTLDRQILEEEGTDGSGSNVDGMSEGRAQSEGDLLYSVPPNLPENLYPPNALHEKNDRDIIVRVMMCSCSQCHNCQGLLYDEEIMGGWSAEDSNLNTLCSSCSKHTVPLLSITVCFCFNNYKLFYLLFYIYNIHIF